MRSYTLLLLALFPFIISSASAEVMMSAPIGVNKITCLTNSDTIVGIPFRKEGSRSTVTSGAPIPVEGQADLVEIPLNSLSLEVGSLNQHYLHFTGGTRNGRWYDITANSANSVTIDLNGDTLDGVTTGDRVTITEYWTLDTLFPPAQATTGWTEDPVGSGNWVPNGHAIVASLGTIGFQRRSEVLLPDTQGSSINRSSAGTYYAFNGQWYLSGGGTNNFGSTVLYPDTLITIRHSSSISHATVFRASGEVLLNNFTIPLHTEASSQRDSYIALPRPVDVTLSGLNLWESGAFMQSLGTIGFQRRDELLVFDNSSPELNRPTTTTYYHNGTSWLAVGDATLSNRDTDVIQAGSGFVIRKYQNTSGTTAFWNNTSSY